MEKSYLIQKLGLPEKRRMAVDQAFGGAALQLKQEAWDILYDIFTIENMGAAEFEFGALPRILNKMCHTELTKFSFVIKAKHIQPNWIRQRAADKERRAYLSQCKKDGIKPKRAKPLGGTADRTIFIICPAVLKVQVQERIIELASGKPYTKRDPGFTYALDPVDESHSRTQGWLDILNGFMFFLNEEMWQKTWMMFESFKNG